MSNRVTRLILRYASQAMIVLAPMVTLNFSVLDIVRKGNEGPKEIIHFLVFDGTKESVELKVRLILSIIAIIILLLFEIFDLYLPLRSLENFRKTYLETCWKDWEKNLNKDVRINIMYARRKWYFLWLASVFEWSWNKGFESPNKFRDANIWLCEFQGVCGLAFRSGDPKSIYFPSQNHSSTNSSSSSSIISSTGGFNLFPWQKSKTEHLLAVISIPLLRKTDGSSPSVKVVGVINLDASTDKGRDFLQRNEDKLVEYFIRYGKILAALRA